ncbi:type I restriction-modification system subunit M N-terminal domain-containing protein, partial [Stenotrophomonas sp. YIM B06876]|uniref:type I restriction-modification system subunit M N-terminal domain-containing protein n=1 Tax=Stenotrophomonas sp. YIM B06876 TaxID=3060211 RepID=UPI002739214B
MADSQAFLCKPCPAPMLTGELRNKVDQVWNAFWSGGIANPLEVIEQITYLLFLRGLDSDQTREENKALRLKTQPVRIYPAGSDSKGRSFDDLRWSRFKNYAAPEMYTVLSEHVFPF